MTELALAVALFAGLGFAPEPYRWMGKVVFGSGAAMGALMATSMQSSTVSGPIAIEKPATKPAPEKAPGAPKK